jgi:hypothetical protein
MYRLVYLAGVVALAGCGGTTGDASRERSGNVSVRSGEAPANAGAYTLDVPNMT